MLEIHSAPLASLNFLLQIYSTGCFNTIYLTYIYILLTLFSKHNLSIFSKHKKINMEEHSQENWHQLT